MRGLLSFKAKQSKLCQQVVRPYRSCFSCSSLFTQRGEEDGHRRVNEKSYDFFFTPTRLATVRLVSGCIDACAGAIYTSFFLYKRKATPEIIVNSNFFLSLFFFSYILLHHSLSLDNHCLNLTLFIAASPALISPFDPIPYLTATFPPNPHGPLKP
ncbi:unnamed protein product [Trypanosoma congolense IL3000]|uniref:WGS project CAEQ00000000 data, annotated contig 1353 n=1 Tax=Trypanosoma congolense (strain IL3000) TaxID=1068625 RepID=F9W5P4_TRYCI|nr:unnamed protein product [Trypanosoma congolense IL3000]